MTRRHREEVVIFKTWRKIQTKPQLNLGHPSPQLWGNEGAVQAHQVLVWMWEVTPDSYVNPWPPVRRTVLGGCGTFRWWSLAVRHGLLMGLASRDTARSYLLSEFTLLSGPLRYNKPCHKLPLPQMQPILCHGRLYPFTLRACVFPPLSCFCQILSDKIRKVTDKPDPWNFLTIN